MLKILHTADIHIGAKFSRLGVLGDLQQIQIQNTFEYIVDLAIEQKVDLFIVAGDLFDSNAPDVNQIHFVSHLLTKLNDSHIYVAVALGTHDYLADQDMIHDLPVEDLPRVKIFSQDSPKWEIPDLLTVIFCNSNKSNKTSESPLMGIQRDQSYKYNIALAHGSVQIPGKSSKNDSPITLEEIEETHMDYIALGHWHNQQQVGKGTVQAWYSGAPEMVALDQKNSGKILLISISDENKVTVESMQVGKKKFVDLSITVDGIHSIEEIVDKIKEVADADTICSVKLIGMVNISELFINVEELEKRLGDKFFFLSIENETVIQDSVELAEGGSILKAKFIEKIKEMNIEEGMKNEAIQLGLSFLDRRTKVY